MLKFSPEPQFEPQTPELNLRFWFSPVLVLSLLSRFSPRFSTSRIYVNSVQTDARFLKPKIGENPVPTQLSFKILTAFVQVTRTNKATLSPLTTLPVTNEPPHVQCWPK